MKLLATTTYFAPVSFYAKLYLAESLMVEQFESFCKQSYRNRAIIASAGGPLPLIVPTEHNGKKAYVKDTKISEHGNWRKMHWSALESAYRKSPYFDYYVDDFLPFYKDKYTYLLDFNLSLHTKVCELLGLDRTTELTDEYISKTSSIENIEDIRPWVEPLFLEKEVQRQAVNYYQVFNNRHGFIAHLSILDLLMNMGPEGLIVLKKQSEFYK